MNKITSVLFVSLATGIVPLLADEAKRERNIEGIADNSFFVEEAYNQEPGVVQHIFTTLYHAPHRSNLDEGEWDLAFTQEWPIFSQRHQFSYTLPYQFIDMPGDTRDGIGDIQLDYRYQLYFDEESMLALAPRVGIILPTGDADAGFGEDTVGGELNLPFSVALSDDVYLHLNAGTTFVPDAASADDRDLWHYNVGASVIYAVQRDLHLMLEWTAGWENSLPTSGNLRHDFSHIISPGVRKALNFDNGAQCVLGLGIPVGLNSGAPDIGAFLYVSFEHFFKRSE